MATLLNQINCLVCSSIISSIENKVNRLDVLFLLRILLEIPEDSQLINDIKLRLNVVQICDQCETTIKQCKQIYSNICKETEKFWEFQNKILGKFSDSSRETPPQQNILVGDEKDDNSFYNYWVNQCSKFVKDHDISVFGYPFIVQDLESLLGAPQIGSSNLKKENDHSTNGNDTEADTGPFNYDPPDTFDDYSDNDSSGYSPPPSKKIKTSPILPVANGDNKDKNENQVEMTPTTKNLEIRLNRLTIGQFICSWPGCNDNCKDGQGKTFKFKECWEDHMNRHRKTDEESQSNITPESYLCVWPNCNNGKGKEFQLKEAWEVHMDRHMKTPKKKCDKCELLFYSKDQLNFHVNREHGNMKKIRRLPEKGQPISTKEILVESESKANGEDDNKNSRRRRKSVKNPKYIFEDDDDMELDKDDKDDDFQIDGDEDDHLSDEGDNDINIKSSNETGEPNEILNCTWPGCTTTKKFKTKTSLEVHMDKHAETPKRKCSKCELYFYSYYELGVHLAKVHKVEKKKDTRPKFKYNLNKDLETGQYHCTWPGCDKTYSARAREMMKSHMDRHNGTPRRECKQCDKVFYSISQLSRHTQKEHVGERNFACEICGACYYVAADLSDHKTKRHSSNFKKWAICETCGKRVNAAHLSSHVRIVHGGEKTVKKYGCHLCEVTLGAEMALKLHLMKTHQVWRDEEEKKEIERWVERRKELRRKWNCPVKKCRQGYLTEEGLSRHMGESHGGDWGDGEGNVKVDRYKYRCEVCGKGFYHVGRWKVHGETHKKMEERDFPFKCEVCGKGFSRVGPLRSHVVVHGKRERKWECEICKKGFFEEKSLQKHFEGKSHRWRVGLVEGGGRECEYCGKVFGTVGCLSQHRRKMHKRKKTVSGEQT